MGRRTASSSAAANWSLVLLGCVFYVDVIATSAMSNDIELDQHRHHHIAKACANTAECVHRVANSTSLDGVSAPPSEIHRNDLTSEEDQLTDLYIGALFQLTGEDRTNDGYAELAAANMAIRDINNLQYVPGYRLQLIYNDTKCDLGHSADAFYNIVYRKPQLVMLIGGSCTEDAQTLGEIVPFWNLLLVSHAAASPALSEREKYPTFHRLAATDSAYNSARIALLRHFNWDTVAVLHEDEDEFSLATNDMITRLRAENITFKAIFAFSPRGTDDLHMAMDSLKNSNARIIVGIFGETEARQVFCKAHELELYGSQYVWLLMSRYSEQWWTFNNTTPCTTDQLATAVDGYFCIKSLNVLTDNQKSVSGMTYEEFLDEYNKQGVQIGPTEYAALIYDSVWVVAMTLRKYHEIWRESQQTQYALESFNYRSSSRMRRSFLTIMESLYFMGVSGPIFFRGANRQSVNLIQQNQGGHMIKTALYHPRNDSLDFHCTGCSPTSWKDDRVPPDEYVVRVRQEHINRLVFVVMTSLAAAGVALAIAFLTFNLYNRNLKYIKLSSPNLNNIAVVGCILIYLSVVFLGIDDDLLDKKYFSTICMTRALLWASAFSLAFGAMFTKTYRVHQIFRRANKVLVRRKLLKDKQLIFMICVLLLIDCAIICAWFLIDPMRRRVVSFPPTPSMEDTDVLYVPQLSTCHSLHLAKWMAVIYAYKGALLLFGVYMAWETRRVKIAALSDSKYIAMNIYNVVLASVTVVSICYVLHDRPTVSYAVIASVLLLSTTVLLGLLFLPKIVARMRDNGALIVTSSGMRMCANTRRFALDEQKELHYRVEVQNRVYKRELIELDQEIVRLERLLEGDYEPCSQAAEQLIFLIPRSYAGNGPLIRRRRLLEVSRYESISDEDDVAMEISTRYDASSTHAQSFELDHLCSAASPNSEKTGKSSHNRTTGANDAKLAADSDREQCSNSEEITLDCRTIPASVDRISMLTCGLTDTRTPTPYKKTLNGSPSRHEHDANS